jgi:hypothetical protein
MINAQRAWKGLCTYMVCSGAGVVVMLVGSGTVFAIDDPRRRLDGEVQTRRRARMGCPFAAEGQL